MISLPNKVLKKQITDEEIRQKGRIKYLDEKLLSVKTERFSVGFQPEDIQEIKSEITRLTNELNMKILDMFKYKGLVKQDNLKSTLEFNHSKYDERNAHLDREMQEMNDRFDHLKKLEQRFQEVMDYAIVYKEEKQRRRLSFNILKDYAYWNRDTNRVVQFDSENEKAPSDLQPKQAQEVFLFLERVNLL